MQYLPMASVKLKDLALFVDGEIIGDGEKLISNLLPLNMAGPEDLSFVEHNKYFKKAMESSAGALLILPDMDIPGKNFIKVANPRLAYVKLIHKYYKIEEVSRVIHPSSVIDPLAEIGPDVAIGPYVVIEEGVIIGARSVIMAGAVLQKGVSIGNDCRIHPNVVIGHNCIIGDRVIIFGGVVIGADGFGYVPDENGRHLKIPQRGIVVLEDDVEIGANTTIDRAVAGETRIRLGTKIDNLVQIAHNVNIGGNTVIASQTGIAGSTNIGSYVMIGGQAGVGEHLVIGDGAIIGAQGGVTGSVTAHTFVSGYPARPHREQMRILGALQQLPELLKRLKLLEERIDFIMAAKTDQLL